MKITCRHVRVAYTRKRGNLNNYTRIYVHAQMALKVKSDFFHSIFFFYLFFNADEIFNAKLH
jgi:hypothetical protein